MFPYNLGQFARADNSASLNFGQLNFDQLNKVNMNLGVNFMQSPTPPVCSQNLNFMWTPVFLGSPFSLVASPQQPLTLRQPENQNAFNVHQSPPPALLTISASEQSSQNQNTNLNELRVSVKDEEETDRNAEITRSLEKYKDLFGEDVAKNERVKGKIYIVRGMRKKWDGKRFAKCCKISTCTKLAQGASKVCKSHGGGGQCVVTGCERLNRGGSHYCALHGNKTRKPESNHGEDHKTKRRRLSSVSSISTVKTDEDSN